MFFIYNIFLKKGALGRAILELGALLWRQRGNKVFNIIPEAKRYLPKWVYKRATNLMGAALADIAAWKVDLGLNNASIQERQALDLLYYSVPSLTHYEDRMSMAMSREIRLPFLDYRLVGLLLPLSPEMKLRKGWTKWCFRKAVADFLPDEIVWRRDKKGFTTPVGSWLKHEWKGHIYRLLGEGMVTEELGLVRRKNFIELYSRYCSNASKWVRSKDIFIPLALELWAREYSSYLKP